MGTWWELSLRMILAAFLGGLIGWERETQRKPAGLRTFMLVSLAAAIYVIASQEMAARQGEVADAVRAMAGVAGGVGFLGAGIILQSRGEVRWLTTAAALWAVAALGMGAGMGMYHVVIPGAVLAFATLKWLALVEDRWLRRLPEEKGRPEDRE
jgi:putative Mg2+ transporter-C (MgtC) family protein